MCGDDLRLGYPRCYQIYEGKWEPADDRSRRDTLEYEATVRLFRGCPDHAHRFYVPT